MLSVGAASANRIGEKDGDIKFDFVARDMSRTRQSCTHVDFGWVGDMTDDCN
jgi:hypothetical protein